MFIHDFVELELRARFTGERRLSNVPGPAYLLAITCSPAESSSPLSNVDSSKSWLANCFARVAYDTGIHSRYRIPSSLS